MRLSSSTTRFRANFRSFVEDLALTASFWASLACLLGAVARRDRHCRTSSPECREGRGSGPSQKLLLMRLKFHCVPSLGPGEGLSVEDLTRPVRELPICGKARDNGFGFV